MQATILPAAIRRTTVGLIAALVLMAPASGWAHEPEAASGKLKVVTITDANAPDTRNVGYLGVATAPVSDELRSHLGLDPGVGLIVQNVLPGTPAATSGLMRHDVLHKLGDQILVNVEQLRTLIRAHKKGEQVELTVIRAGKPIKVTLTVDQKQIVVTFEANPASSRLWRNVDALDDDYSAYAEDAGGGIFHLSLSGGRVTAMTIDDGAHVLSLNVDDKGGKHFLVKDKAGKVIFDGPVTTPNDRAKVPAELRAKLGQIEASMSVRMHTLGVAPGADAFQFIRRVSLDLAGRLPTPAEVEAFIRDAAPDARARLVERLLEDAKVRDAAQVRNLRQLPDRQTARPATNLENYVLGAVGVTSGGGEAVPAAVAVSTATYSDGEHELTIRDDNTGRRLTAKDKAGHVLFDGPIDTESQRKQIPDAVRRKVERLEATAHIQIDTSKSISGGQPSEPH